MVPESPRRPKVDVAAALAGGPVADEPPLGRKVGPRRRQAVATGRRVVGVADAGQPVPSVGEVVVAVVADVRLAAETVKGVAPPVSLVAVGLECATARPPEDASRIRTPPTQDTRGVATPPRVAGRPARPVVSEDLEEGDTGQPRDGASPPPLAGGPAVGLLGPNGGRVSPD